MQKLAASAGFANWGDAKQCVIEVVDALGHFSSLAQQQGVSQTTVLAIEKTLLARRQENSALLL